MWKAISALVVVAATVAGALTLLPAMNTGVSASVPNASAKTDRFDAADCDRQGWPYYGRECIKDHTRNAGRSLQVRLISTDRIYAEPSAPLPEWAAYLPATHPAGTIHFTVGR
jgi:hypothetical protein